MDINELRQKHYNATVVSVRRIHETLVILRVRSDQGRLEYQPGQYTILALGGWEDRFDGPGSIEDEKLRSKLIKRAYSIACTLYDDDKQLHSCYDYEYLEFYITLVPRPDHETDKRPPLTPRLFALKTGDRLHMSTHVVGHYTLDHVKPGQNVVLAATGTGEAPHNAMSAELLKRGHTGNIASMVCVRYRQDAAYIPEQVLLNKQFSNYRYGLYTTRERENLEQDHPEYVGKQYLQDIIKPDVFRNEFGWDLDPANTQVYLCGNPAMIGVPHKNSEGVVEFPQPPGLLELLSQQGFEVDPHSPNANVHYEKYW